MSKRLRFWWTRQVVVLMVRLGWKFDLAEKQERMNQKLDEIERLIDEKLTTTRTKMRDGL